MVQRSERPTPQQYLEQGRFHYKKAGGEVYIEGLFDDKAAAKGAIEYLRAENAMPKKGGALSSKAGVIIEIDDPHQMRNFDLVIQGIEDNYPEAKLVREFNASREHHGIERAQPHIGKAPGERYFDGGIWDKLVNDKTGEVELRAAFADESYADGASRYLSHMRLPHTRKGNELHVTGSSTTRLEEVLAQHYPEIHDELSLKYAARQAAEETPLPVSRVEERDPPQLTFAELLERQDLGPRGKGR